MNIKIEKTVLTLAVIAILLLVPISSKLDFSEHKVLENEEVTSTCDINTKISAKEIDSGDKIKSIGVLCFAVGGRKLGVLAEDIEIETITT